MGLNPLVQRVFKGLFDRNKTSFVSPFQCPSLFTASSSRARGWLRFRFRTLGSLGRRGGATDGGHGSRIAAAFTLRSSKARARSGRGPGGVRGCGVHVALLPWVPLRECIALTQAQNTEAIRGVDGVRTVERERARRMDVSRTRGERGFGGGGSCGLRRMTSRALGRQFHGQGTRRGRAAMGALL